MRINKCDNCNRTIKPAKGLSLYYGYGREIEMCQKCAYPIIVMITDKALLKPEIISKLSEGEPLLAMQKKLKARLRT